MLQYHTLRVFIMDNECAESCPPPTDSGVRQELVECPQRSDNLFETVRGSVGGHVVFVDLDCRHRGGLVPARVVKGGVGKERSEHRWRRHRQQCPSGARRICGHPNMVMCYGWSSTGCQAGA